MKTPKGCWHGATLRRNGQEYRAKTIDCPKFEADPLGRETKKGRENRQSLACRKNELA
jgi:hypothetical protein